MEMQSYTQNEIVEMIKEAGLKYTEHRYNILNKIAKSKSPISAHKLIEDIKKKYDIDQATVYRNLTSLEQVGIIKKSAHKISSDSHSHAHYEVNTGEYHHKVICNNCETIEKVSGINTEDLLKKIVKKSKKFNTSNIVNFEVYGLCKVCA